MCTRSGRARLWEQVGDLFDTDDGSLPELRIVGVGSAADAGAVYRALAHLGEPLNSDQLVAVGGRQVLLKEIPDAGMLAAFGIVESLHVVLSGVIANERLLPDLGVRVDRGGDISIDYRPGDDWNQENVAAFIELLDDLSRLTPGSSLVAADPSGTPLPADVQTKFSSAIKRYLHGV